MANRQLVMLACVDSHRTPLVKVKHDFSHLNVTGLGEGDEVWFEGVNGAQHRVRLSAGLTPFPKIVGLTHFLIEKVSGSAPLATNIEVLRGS